MENKMSTTQNTGPRFATAPRLTIGDLEQDVSLGNILEAVEYLKGTFVDQVVASIEHWTDDEGVHFTPLMRELSGDVTEFADDLLRELARAAK